MTYQANPPTIDYRPCQYAGCPITFRGPPVEVAHPFVAVLGSSEVYGRYVHEPFTDLIAQHLQVPVANFGVHNAGLDLFVRDEALQDFAGRARIVILQVMGAQNMSNRFYSVHPRRNDRFIRYSHSMQQLFKRIDFSDFVFTRHMLLELQKADPHAFAELVREMEISWVARMEALLDAISCQVLLVHIRQEGDSALGPEPLFVSPRMIDAVRPRVAGLVECDVTHRQGKDALDQMVFSGEERDAARYAMSPLAHEDVGRSIVEALRPWMTDLEMKPPRQKSRPGAVA